MCYTPRRRLVPACTNGKDVLGNDMIAPLTLQRRTGSKVWHFAGVCEMRRDATINSADSHCRAWMVVVFSDPTL